MKRRLLIICSIFLFTAYISRTRDQKVLVFFKTAGYKHTSINAGISSIQQLGNQYHFVVDTTSNDHLFTENNLEKYSAVIFLQTTGDVLNHVQEAAFERYIQSGGGYVGIHAAADAEYDWQWYGKLVGGYFNGHPEQQEADLKITHPDHLSTKSLPEKWRRKDEWYNFQYLDTSINVVIMIDEKSYHGGTNGDYHPVAWYHEYDGGRAFYTALGHTEESYSDPLFLQHLLGGIQYTIGLNYPLDYKKAKTKFPPNEKYFSKTVLSAGQFTEPTEMAILPSLDILVAQRRGELLFYNHRTKQLTQAGKIDVYFESKDTTLNAEEGLMGIAADPAFEKNKFIYLYYAAADTALNRLSRFTLFNNKMERSSEKIIIEFYSQRDICCHTGGSITFDKNGLLYLSTGDNTTPFNEPGEQFTTQGFAPLDDRPGHEQYDGRRTSGNTNDLRGKILRLKINSDGTYDIPAGNLFAPSIPNTRPEIYVMGTRNPYRISVDQKNNYLYWGEVGPDAAKNDNWRGPMGYDEINQAKAAGNFGYPLFIGFNYPYREFDFATGLSGDYFNPTTPVNNSRNNTGLIQLPPAQPALICYPYAPSYFFPQLGSGGRTAMAGPVYYADLYKPAKNKLPEYYSGKLFIYEWMRGWIKVVSVKTTGELYKIEPFMSGTTFNAPVDMEMGSDGKLYILEYGKGWFSKNNDAALSRIDYDVSQTTPIKENKRIIKPPVDSAAFKIGHQQKNSTAPGLTAIQSSDCLTCHKTSDKSIGPSFLAVAQKYSATERNKNGLANKIIFGGSGVWGEVTMPAHPTISVAQSKLIIDYIFSLVPKQK